MDRAAGRRVPMPRATPINPVPAAPAVAPRLGRGRRWPVFRAGIGVGAVALAAGLALFSLQTGPVRHSPPPPGGPSQAFQLTGVRTVSTPVLAEVIAQPTTRNFAPGQPVAFDITYAHPGQLTTLQVTISSPPIGSSPQQPVFVDAVLLQQTDGSGEGHTPFVVHARREAFAPGQHYLVTLTLNGSTVGSTEFDVTRG